MDFFEALVRYEVTLWNAMDRELTRREQLSLGQLHALRIVLRYAGEARVQELSDDIGITVGAASKLVDRLERDGLVERHPNPANRRSSLITVTPAGRSAVTAANRTCRTVLARVTGDEDVSALTEALRRLQTQIDASIIGSAA